MAGRVDGGTLRFETTCRTRAVRRHIDEETGHELSINHFQTTSGVERLDIAPLPRLMPAEVRDDYGWFGIAVRAVPPRNDQPFFSFALRGATRGEQGVRWLRENKTWIAYKRYGEDVVLLWVGDGSRRLDQRWQRLDRVLRRLPSRS